MLVVDDASPDGTGDLADRMSAADDRISVLHRTEKSGLGGAYLAGFAWASQHGFDLVVELDADGSHPPERLPALIDAVESDSSGTVGGSIGSRWVPGGSVVNWPWTRKLISRGGSWYARLMLGVPIRDVTAGYRVYRLSALRAIGVDDVDSRGYCFQIDLTRRMLAAGFTLVELPIEFRERELGESKMSTRIVAEAMAKVTVWGFSRIRSAGKHH